MAALLTQNPRQKCDVNIVDGVTGEKISLHVFVIVCCTIFVIYLNVE